MEPPKSPLLGLGMAQNTNEESKEPLVSSRRPRRTGARAMQHKSSKWNKGVLYDLGATVIILLLHVAFAIWGHFYYQESESYWENFGFRILGSAADCNSLSQLRTGLSLLFNVLAAILPIFSGNTLLALASPTRAQLDDCHASGQSMDIGAHSFSNIMKKFIPWRQKIIWGALVLLSLPFHVL